MTGIQEAPVHALLADGTTVRIRQAGPSDREEVRRLYEEMSPQNLRLRFFSVSPSSARQAAERVARGERSGYRALAAECGRLVGLADYEDDAVPLAGVSCARRCRSRLLPTPRHTPYTVATPPYRRSRRNPSPPARS
ncbi:hypothetical protein [Streptomyces olivaceoviridis]|uniref:hypothetical protein n=1 Tax=Streptomyces olivaceoviridis TaxID=1921 RepID=UPI003F4C8072